MTSGSLQRGGSQSSFGLNEVCHQVVTDFKGQPVLSLEDTHLPDSTCTKPSVDSGWDGVQEREGNWWRGGETAEPVAIPGAEGLGLVSPKPTPFAALSAPGHGALCGYGL